MGQRVAKQKEIESECDPVGNQDWENVSVVDQCVCFSR